MFMQLGRWQPKAVERAPSPGPPNAYPRMRACRSLTILYPTQCLKPRSEVPAVAAERGFTCLNGASGSNIRHHGICARRGRLNDIP